MPRALGHVCGGGCSFFAEAAVYDAESRRQRTYVNKRKIWKYRRKNSRNDSAYNREHSDCACGKATYLS